MTGPTGSGKTTTIYAGLHAFWDAHQVRNVVTIEDPIDIRLPFANQVAVHEGGELSFARILRSVLRQDLDVLLVGEIRDVVGAALRGVTSQRLLPAACLECRGSVDSDKEREVAEELCVRDILAVDDLSSGALRAGVGCPACRESGGRGRVAAYEVLSISPKMRALVESGSPDHALRSAIKEGEFVPMESYVRSLLMDGITSPSSALAAFPSPASVGLG